VRAGLVYLRPKLVGFVRATGPYSESSGKAWASLKDWLERHNLSSQVTTGFGLHLDAPSRVDPASCRYEACVELGPEYQNLRTDGLAFQTLPGGAFARIRHVGPYETVRTSIIKLREEWLPAQPRLLPDRRRALMVVYLDDAKKRSASKLRCDVCIPVRTHYEDALGRARNVDRPDGQAAGHLSS
jgi:AraC family transcriptional regulator